MQPRNVNYVSRISTLVDADKILDRECFEGLSWMVGGLEDEEKKKRNRAEYLCKRFSRLPCYFWAIIFHLLRQIKCRDK